MRWTSGRLCLRLTLAAGVACLLPCDAAQAQKRIYAIVQPNEGKEPADSIVFDVNVEPSDNISPNVLFSADGKRGFVAYAGSGLVLAFSMETGMEIERIRTEGKPQFATLLPGGVTAAYVSMLDNRIFIVDLQNLRLLDTYTFAGAQFGFGSQLALSPDGASGYISSTGTGEVIRFNLADGKETARLAGFEAPAQITVTPDGGTVIVVDTLKDEVVLVNDSSFTRKTSFKDEDATINFTIFNKPVLAPDGKTGIIASRDNNGLLGSDTVFLFDAAAGTVLDKAIIGSEPGFTGLTPDGSYWVIYCEFTIHMINTADFKEILNFSVLRENGMGSANIVFSPDGRYMFYPSSVADQVFQHDWERDAVLGQILVGDNPNFFLDQPCFVALTPDGKNLAVVNYVSNNIELLTDSYELNGSKFISSSENYTGITLINLSDHEANFTVFALDNFGQVLQGEGIDNPQQFTVPPNQQIAFTVAEIFHFDDVESREGWLSVISDQEDVAGYVTVGDTSMARADGYPLRKMPIRDWIVPEAVRKEGQSTEFNFTNVFFNQANYDLARIFADGTVAETRVSNPVFPNNRQTQLFEELFLAPEEIEDGYLRMVSRQGVLFTEFFGGEAATGALNGIDMEEFQGIKKIYSPQFSVLPGFKTTLNVINGSTEEATVRITLRADDGTAIGEPLERTLAANAQIKSEIRSLFEEITDLQDVTGWIEIESTQDELVGTVTFTDEEQKYLTSFALLGKPMEKLLFPTVAEDGNYLTGLALLNSGEETATVTLELWGPGGTIDRSETITLAGMSRKALFLSSFFPNLEPRLRGNLRVRSDKPLYGISLITGSDFGFMVAVPAQPLP